MSLAIDVDDVTAVLLADGWHQVADASFTLDSYEYLWAAGGPQDDPMILHGGGRNGICAIGFDFEEKGSGRIAGPLSSILAVRYAGRRRPMTADRAQAPALEVYEALARLLVDNADRYTENQADADLVDDALEHPGLWPDCRISVRYLLDELHRGMAAQMGAGFSRRMETHDGWAPLVIEATADSHPAEFPDGFDVDDPAWSWMALAHAERRACGWDFAADPENGTWLGWFEPTSACGADGRWHVSGLLVGFVIVDPDRHTLRRAFVASTRRREGIAAALYRAAVDRFGPLEAEGPFSEAGAAFWAAMTTTRRTP